SYTTTFVKNFRGSDVSAYLDYNYQSYWDRPENQRWSLTAARYMDIGRFKSISVSLSAYLNNNGYKRDTGGYLSLSMPFGNNGTLGVNSSVNGSDITNSVSYNARVDNRTSYQIRSGVTRNGMLASGYVSHNADIAEVNANASFDASKYSSIGAGLRGGATITTKGAALHRTTVLGGSRIMVDTDDVADIPVNSGGSNVRTNLFGIAVIPDVANYFKNEIKIDVDKLPKNAESTGSLKQFTLTEGAVGYRTFDVLAGEKGMGIIRLQDGSYPPFGATVKNTKGQATGLVGDNGNVYLSGIIPGQDMRVSWGDNYECDINLPEGKISGESMLLPCIKAKKPVSVKKIEIAKNEIR
ncbi:fimbria/pilus outer membrane usher protein, partial [Pantoea endophytica]